MDQEYKQADQVADECNCPGCWLVCVGLGEE